MRKEDTAISEPVVGDEQLGECEKRKGKEKKRKERGVRALQVTRPNTGLGEILRFLPLHKLDESAALSTLALAHRIQ
jgi:hypothetical protein